MMGRTTYLIAGILAVLFISTAFVPSIVVADRHDVILSDGDTHWQGQVLLFSHSLIESNDNIVIADTSGDEHSTLSANANGEIYIQTDTLDVDRTYVVYHSEEEEILAEFDLVTQTISVSSDSELVYNHSNINNELTFDVLSNRADYRFRITEESDALSPDQIDDIFEGGVIVGESGERFYERSGSDDLELTGNFADVPSGEYTFSFNAIDSTASTTITVNVLEPDEAEAQFEESIYTEQEGDQIRMTVETTDVNKFKIKFGDEEEKNYEYTFEVKMNGEDQVTLIFDSAEAGTGVQPFAVAEGSNAEIVNGGSDQPLVEPLKPGFYDMELSIFDEVIDISAIELVERETSTAESYVAPRSESINSISDFNSEMTQNSEIANGDKVGFKVEVSGVYSYITEDTTIEDLVEGSDFEEENGLMVTWDSTSDDIDVSKGKMFRDEENDMLYFVFDTRDLNYDSGQDYQFMFQINENNPYVHDPSDAEAITSVVTFESRSAQFLTNNEAGFVELANVSGSRVVGTTTVSPGTEIQLVTRSGSPYPFVRTTTTTVEDNKRFTFTIDLSDVEVEHEFRVEISSLTSEEMALAVHPDDFEVSQTGPPFPFTLTVQSSTGDSVSPETVTLTKDPFTQEITVEEGEGEIEVDEQGEYTLNIDAEGYEAYAANVIIDEPTEFVAILTPEEEPDEEPEGGTLRLNITNEEGEPLPDATVTLNDKQIQRANDEGVVEFTNVSSGEHDILIEAPLYESAEQTVDIEDETVEQAITLNEPEEEEGQFLFGFYVNSILGLILLSILTYYLYNRLQGSDEEEESTDEPNEE